LRCPACAGAGTGPNGINVAAVLRNSGPVPATVTGASLRATFGEDVLGEGEQLTPRHVPDTVSISATFFQVEEPAS
jgi:hypothetical protein